jgi:hypothetical protein
MGSFQFPRSNGAAREAKAAANEWKSIFYSLPAQFSEQKCTAWWIVIVCSVCVCLQERLLQVLPVIRTHAPNESTASLVSLCFFSLPGGVWSTRLRGALHRYQELAFSPARAPTSINCLGLFLLRLVPTTPFFQRRFRVCMCASVPANFKELDIFNRRVFTTCVFLEYSLCAFTPLVFFIICGNECEKIVDL